MQTQSPGSTVVLSDAQDAPMLAAKLADRAGATACYESVADLVRTQPLSSVSVLVLHFHNNPKGVVLAALGRLNVEYPGMQKVAVLDEEPPLPIAEYLTSCGVSLLWNKSDEGQDEQLAMVINRLHERTRWIAS